MLKQPKIRHLLDAPKDDWYVLEEPVLFMWKELGHVRIPAGYVSDGCSVPKLLWGAFPPLGVYFVPGLVHDYLYERKEVCITLPAEKIKVYKYRVTQKEADELFLKLLNHYSPHTKRSNYLRYLYVRALGRIGWKNAKYVDIHNYKN